MLNKNISQKTCFNKINLQDLLHTKTRLMLHNVWQSFYYNFYFYSKG